MDRSSKFKNAISKKVSAVMDVMSGFILKMNV